MSYIVYYQKCPACKMDCKLTPEEIALGLNECVNQTCPVDKFYVDQVNIFTKGGEGSQE